MDYSPGIFSSSAMVTLLSVAIWIAATLFFLGLLKSILTLPMRRAERARLFLDVIETALKNGRPIEEAVVSLDHSHDKSMGVPFHQLAVRLEQGLLLRDALAKSPGFLPPQITAMMAVGQKMGDLRKVLPACRQLLKDAISQTRGAISYLVILTFVITPMSVGIFAIMQTMIVPAAFGFSFSRDDVKDLSSLVDKLRKHSDPVSAFLWDDLSKSDQETLRIPLSKSYPSSEIFLDYPGWGSSPAPDPVLDLVLQVINRKIGDRHLDEGGRFQGISLRPETIKLMAQSPSGGKLVRLNRLLFEDAYPAELSRNRVTAIDESVGDSTNLAAGLHYHRLALIILQSVVLLLLWLAALIYAGGPCAVAWFPILERLHYRLPWRRKRMQRDFSTMLAILLDSGVPEPDAVTLAADCSANKIFRRRAARAVESLEQGIKLSQAVQSMDDSGEFGWRLTNAFHGHSGFLKALTGWHESLDAKAFQQEQAAAHGITTALVLWSGLFVGAVVISVFTFLISIIDAGTLW